MRSKDLIGFFNILVVIGVLGAISYAAVMLQPAEYDSETLCLADEQPPHVVVMIDRTEVIYTPAQAGQIRQTIIDARNGLEVGERLSVFELNHRGEIRNTNRFSVCNPGRGDQINPLYRNPQRVQARYDALFERPLDQALEGLFDLIDSPITPLLESLAELGTRPEFDRTTPRRRVVLISDMFQNTRLYTVYGWTRQDLENRLPPPSDVAEAIREQYGDVLWGVELDVYYVDQPGWNARERAIIRAHWREIFRELGVRDRWTEF
ncbi:hypothetical protein F1654_01260 [Alkalicaulis satelles]|uniref:Uncharacterized protein n=1 Tax=Alkalicaulis satelles TaxID=2609175 RepID=A0A5M6ZIL2_9PROT|nr:hypothetical protein [Alkalicaulis satelles]KAA5804663.1 hypothetical protein F1654_01260 [Alkalicaulis satelles]